MPRPLQANQVISHANADLKQVVQDKMDIEGAAAAVHNNSAPSAPRRRLQAKVNAVKAAKYADIETLMTTDIKGLPKEGCSMPTWDMPRPASRNTTTPLPHIKRQSPLRRRRKNRAPKCWPLPRPVWARCMRAQARWLRPMRPIEESAKDDPARAPMELRNEAMIFFQMHNSDAQVAAADEALKVNPNDAVLYYIKGRALLAVQPSIPRRSASFCLLTARPPTRSTLNWRLQVPSQTK